MSHHHRPYGVGLGHRNILHQEILAHRDEIDVLEIFTENYIVRQRRLKSDPDQRLLREAAERFPCIAHGVSLSIGSVDPLNNSALENTRALLDATGIEHISEHLSFHQMRPRNLTFFLCLPFVDESVAWVARNYHAACALLGRDMALENVSYYFAPPNGSYDEPEFLARILEHTGCTLLLDVTNVYNNCVNTGQDPVAYIRRLPPDRVRHVHLAGGHYEDGFLKDSHSYPVMEEVWELFEEAVKHCRIEVAVIERDENFEPFSGVMTDVRRAREIFYRHRPAAARDYPPAIAPAAVPAPGPADPEAADFAGLRAFQHALLRQLTDEHFRLQVRLRPESVRDFYPMNDEWFERWRGCSEEQIAYLADVWSKVDREERRDDEDFRRWEWRRWASHVATT